MRVPLFCLFVTSCLGQYEKISIVDYYVNLINQETSKAYQFPPPKNAYQHAPMWKDLTDYGTFDHIVVGAGSAGAVIANRLSEDTRRNVLLLEAGGYSDKFSDIPAMLAYLNGMHYNWGYLSVPQTTACLGLKNRQCPMHRGKGMGGSTMINGLVYARGNRRDFDKWYEEGNRGWSYNDVLPYFKKSENFPEGDPTYHGKSGYLKVEVPKLVSPELKAFFEANRYLGLKELDYNGEEQIGFARTQLNIRHGVRESTGNAFLLPIAGRQNLRMLPGSYVTKILIDKQKRAFGVLFTQNGRMYVARSRKDIVISAGAFGSPQLLMLSGIGPRAHLNRMGIPVVEDLPVGQNLLDHLSLFYLNFETNHTRPPTSLEKNVRDYLNGTGEFVNPFNLQAVVFTRTKHARRDTFPNFEALILPWSGPRNLTDKLWNVQDDLRSSQANPQNQFTIIGVLLHPKSKGCVKLKSKNPYQYPIIDPNWLSDPNGEDIEALYDGIRFVTEMIDTPPFRQLDARFKYEFLPACKDLQYMSKDYWYCFIRHYSTGLYHPIGTCKMGPHPSKGAVVDPELKVFGVSNLRVADASIFPSTTSGHTSAPAMMVGEKAADLIRSS